ncbi:MAG: CAP domain-containing protein, partial [Kineosporiaceae bacterium]
AEAAALPRAEDPSRDGDRAAGSARQAPDGASSLPTWTGPAAPVGPVAESTAAPGTASPTTSSPTETRTPDPGDGATTAGTRETPAPTSGGSPTESAGTATGLVRQVLDLINAERVDAGCPALTVDDRLAEAAGAHAADMVARQYFDHTSPDGSTPSSRAAAAGYPGPVAENIATGYSSAATVVEGWLDSPGHRANILDCDQRVTGIGHDPGSLPGYAPGTWVQVFGAG